MGGLEPWHWIVLALVVAALFFSNKLPDAARSVGRSLRIFKTEIKGMSEDDKARAKAHDEAEDEQKALPPAEVVKREALQQPSQDAERARPRPTPNP
jgi:sec-independent protein translocase protein TatA